jgi:hypothetical protein
MIKRAIMAGVLLAASQGVLAQGDYGYDDYENSYGGYDDGGEGPAHLFYAIAGFGAALQDESWYDGSTPSFSLGFGAMMTENIAFELAYNNFGEAEGNTGFVPEEGKPDLRPYVKGLAQSVSGAFVWRRPTFMDDHFHFLGKWGFEYYDLEVTAPGMDEGSHDRTTVFAGFGAGFTYDRYTIDFVTEFHKWRTGSELLPDLSTQNVQLQLSIAF